MRKMGFFLGVLAGVSCTSITVLTETGQAATLSPSSFVQGQVVHSLSQFESIVAAIKQNPNVQVDLSTKGTQTNLEMHKVAEGIYAKTHSITKWANYLAAQGQIVYVPAVVKSRFSPLSDPQGVYITQNGDGSQNIPTESFNPYTQEQTIGCSYAWKGLQYIEPDYPVFGINVGELDSMGMSFSNMDPVQVASAVGYGYDSYGNLQFQATSWTSVVQGNEFSFQFEGQDKEVDNHTSTNDYSWYFGSVEVTMKPNWSQHGEVCMTYTHTWKSTNISGFSLSVSKTPSLNVQFSTQAYGWTAGSAYGTY